MTSTAYAPRPGAASQNDPDPDPDPVISWDVALASVRGSEHARLQRNNQDAAAAFGASTRQAIAVADGCS